MLINLLNETNTSAKSNQKKDDDQVERSIRMVVLNTVCNFSLRLIMTILSLSDLFLLITSDYSRLKVQDMIHYFDFDYFMKYICSSSKSCQLLRKYGNLLYIISLTLNIVFFYKFDKKFNLAFRQIFFPPPPKNQNNINNKASNPPLSHPAAKTDAAAHFFSFNG